MCKLIIKPNRNKQPFGTLPIACSDKDAGPGGYSVSYTNNCVKKISVGKSLIIKYDKTQTFAADTVTTVNIDEDRLEIVTDPLGVSPLFYYKTPHDLVVSDELWECARHTKNIAVDDRYVAEMLFFGYVWSHHLTMHPDIIKTRGSSNYVYKNGVMAVSHHSYPFEVSMNSSKENVQHAIDEFSHLLRPEDQDSSISAELLKKRPLMLLSGGYDSRVCLQAIINQKIDFDLLTLGYPSSKDVKLAKLLAQNTGKALKRVSFDSEWIYRNSEAVIKLTSASANVQTGFLLGVPQNANASQPLICGLYGDQITGDRLNTYKRIMGIANRRKRDNALVSAFNWGLRISELENINSAYSDYISNISRLTITEHVSSLYDVRNIDWRKRQLQYNQCVVPLLTSSGAELRLPFISVNLINSWSSLSDDFLINQRLYRKLINEQMSRPLGSVPFEKNKSIARKVYVKLFNTMGNYLDPCGNKIGDLAYIDYTDQLYNHFSELKSLIFDKYPTMVYLFDGVGNKFPASKIWFLYSVILANEILATCTARNEQSS